MADRWPTRPDAARLEAREALERYPGTGITTDVAAVLVGAGDLLRRGSSVNGPPAAVDAALRDLSQATILAWLGTLDAPACATALARAAELALDAALAESPEECEAATAQAMAELAGRDRLESARCAIKRREELVLEPCGADRIAALIAEIDGALRPRARVLSSLNEARRAERDRIAAEAREAAWWYSARAECDDLVGLLAGKIAYGGDHLHGCADCQRDLAATEPVSAPMDRHVTPGALWRHDLGIATPAERDWLTRRSKKDKALAQALWAYEDGERAVAEVSGPPAAPKWEVVEEQPGARLLLQRSPRARVMVRLDNPAAAKATVLLLPRQTTLTPQRTAVGLEFDLGTAEELRGQTARVTVSSKEAGELVSDIEL